MVSPALALAACLGSSPFRDGFVQNGALRAEGFEQVRQSPPRPFTVLRSRGQYSFDTTCGIDGSLVGTLRSEVGGPNGYFTWLSGRPRFVLQLAAPSLPEVAFATAPARMVRSAYGREGNHHLVAGLSVIGRTSIASRACDILSFTDASPLVQNIALDTTTSIPLRQIDLVGGAQIYQRQINQLEVAADPNASDFEPPKDAIVIKGDVGVEILAAAEGDSPRASYESDLDTIKKQTSLAGGSWIQAVSPPTEFTYMASSYFERGPGRSFADYINPLLALCSNDQLMRIGSLPEGLGREDSRSQATVSLGRGAPFAYCAPDGRVIASAQAGQSVDVEWQGIARSEFLNEQTGDTIVFFQIRNAPMIAAFEGLRLESPRHVWSRAHPDMTEYRVSKPTKMTVLEWRSVATEYVLVATGSGIDSLRAVAEQTR